MAVHKLLLDVSKFVPMLFGRKVSRLCPYSIFNEQIHCIKRNFLRIYILNGIFMKDENII